MKIRIFIGGLSGGGAERVCCNIANFLADKNHEVEIITMADDKATYGLSSKVHRMILLSESERKMESPGSAIPYPLISFLPKEDEISIFFPKSLPMAMEEESEVAWEVERVKV